MSSSRSQNTKTNFRNKLSLKRSNSDSTQSTLSSKIISCSKSDTNNTDNFDKSVSQDENTDNKPNVEDSLADFKSPKEKVSKPILNKFKFEKEKVKRKLVKSKSKTSKAVVDTNQPSIESSFFKPQTSNQPEVKEAFPCPLCLKPFKDDLTCINHMKTCAAKNKVSVQQMLEAKKLQERQAEERKAMGLLAAPVIPEKKKTFRSKNYTTADDPQLQLVLAMSESLYEAEQQKELEEAAALAGIPSECLKNINAEERKTLQGFGFLTNKPAVELPVKQSKKRKLLGPTVLQSRSKEDKDRVLTERIACIITGDDALTQKQTDLSIDPSDKPPAQIRSRKLRSIEQLSNKLWDVSRLTKKCNDFYVEDLRSHFLPTDQQKEDAEILAVPFEENNSSVLLNASIEYEPVDIELLVNQNKESESLEMSETKKMNSELDFIKSSASNWVQTLNSHTKSDIIILVKNNKEIYAHSLVLFVQCPQILHSKEPNDSLKRQRIKEKISWLTRDQLSALAFLEFIYCGCIDKYIDVFKHENLLNEVKELAKKYDVKNLCEYIKFKQDESKSKRREDFCNKNKYRWDSPSQSGNLHLSTGHSPNVHSPNFSPTQQFKTPTPKKLISFENYKQTQGLPATETQYTPSSKNISKRHRGTQTNNPKSVVKKNKETQTTNLENADMFSKNLEVLDTSTEMSTVSAEIPCTSNKPVASTPASYPKSILKKRFTSSPVLFESEDESIFGPSSQKSNQMEASPDNTCLNILVELANKNDDEMDVASQSEHKKQAVDNPDDNKLPNSQDTIINLSPSPEDLENPSPLLENIHVQTSNEKSAIAENIIATDNQITSPANPDINVSAKSSVQDAEVVDLDSENEESIYDAVTPPRRNSVESNPKNDIELDSFLRKVKRINAKGALESDSESDISLPQQARRNPFLTRNRDDSYRYLRNVDNSVENRRVISILERDVSRDEKLQNARNTKLFTSSQTSGQSAEKSQSANISVNKDLQNDDPRIVDDLQHEKSASDTSLNNTKNNSNQSSSNLDSQDVTMNESELSMYSRYKRQNVHNNSIQNYRKELNFESKRNFSQQTIDNTYEKGSDHSSSSSSRRIIIRSNSPTRAEVDDITLVYDSDDQEVSSKFMTQKKTSSQSSTELSLKDSDRSNVRPTIFRQSQIENCNISSVDLVSKKNPKIMDSSMNELIDITNDSDEENDRGYDNSNKNYLSSKRNSDSNLSSGSTPEPASLEKNEFKEKEKSSSSKESTRKYDDCDIITLSPLSVLGDEQSNENENESQPKTSSKNKSNVSGRCSDSNKNDDHDLGSFGCEWFNDLDNYNNWTNKSPIEVTKNKSQSTSNLDKFNIPTKGTLPKSRVPESASLPRGTRPYEKYPESHDSQFPSTSFSNNLQTPKNQFSEFDSPQSPLPSSSRDTRPSKYNYSKFDSPQSQAASFSKSAKTSKNQYSDLPQPSPASSSKYTRPSVIQYSEFDSPRSPSPEEIDELSQNVREQFSSSPILSQNRKKSKAVRKLQTKSASTSNFETPPKKRMGQKYHEYEDALKNLSSYDTPQLHKELKKFGLKPQNRKNSRLLLSHVYTGMVKQRSKSPNSKKRILNDDLLSEDGGPPLKKQNISEKTKKSSFKEKSKTTKDPNSENREVLNEEMDSDEDDMTGTIKGKGIKVQKK